MKVILGECGLVCRYGVFFFGSVVDFSVVFVYCYVECEVFEIG